MVLGLYNSIGRAASTEAIIWNDKKIPLLLILISAFAPVFLHPSHCDIRT